MTNTNTGAGADQLRGWVGRTLVDPAGDKIGHIEDIYMDTATGQPEWLAVTTGWFGRRVSFVPISGASAHGDDIASRWDKARIKDAPHAEPDGELSPQQESGLYRHYGLQPPAAGSGQPAPGTTGQAGQTATAGVADRAATAGPRGVVGNADGATARGTAPATGQTAGAGTTGTAGMGGEAGATPDAGIEGDVVRSEEELQIAKEQHESGRVRLRKWVETEHVTRTVPLSHEEVRLQREPIGADEAAAGMGDTDLSESDREIVLNEEQLVVNKRIVPKERVRMSKETVTEDIPVEADLRRERVEVDGMDDKPR